MKKIIVLCLTLILTSFSLQSFANIASPSVAGSWRVVFYLEPARSLGASQCIVFTTVPGTVAGVPTSGTWTSPTFPGWTGQWIQLGDHVRWFGVTGSLATSESGNMIHANIFGGVSFNHFLKTNATTSSAGNWYAIRTASCAGVNSENSDGTDPAGKIKI